MTYTISIGNHGSECVAGEIPDSIWKYVQDKCDGDVDIYKEKLEEDKVPKKYKLAEDLGDFYTVSGFFDCYAPYDGGTLTVTDEDDNEFEIEANDLAKETDCTSCTVGKPYFVWESCEKGYWNVEIDIDDDEEFDKSKLKLHIEKLSYSNDEYSHDFITAVEYDGEVYDVELSESRGISYELDFYEAEDTSED